MTNIVAMNKMTDCELGKVAGGTVKEFEEIMDACYNKQKTSGAIGAFASELWSPGSYFTRSSYVSLVPAFEKVLKQDLNIDTHISVGWNGTGFRSVPNTYSINGKSISHQEVLNMKTALSFPQEWHQ